MPIVGFKSDAPAEPRVQPPRLDPELPVVAANGDGFPHPRKLPEHHTRFYLPLRLKLLFVALCSLGWVGFSLWLAIPWINDLGASITVPVAAAVIAGIAIIPGYLNAHLISSLLIDKAPPLRFDIDFPAITLVVAAAACVEQDPRITVRRFAHGGKANTLNKALATVETPLVATLDADTLLM